MNDTRLRRGFILHALHANYPHPLARPSLERTVSPFYQNDARALERDLAYLEEKKLIERKGAEIGNRVVHSFAIEPAGIDIVEGSTADPGIEIAGG